MALCASFLSVSPLYRTLESISPRGFSFFCSCARFLGLRAWRSSTGDLGSRVDWRGGFRRWSRGRLLFSLSDDLDSRNGSPVDGHVKKRDIVEHILLLRAKEDLSDDQEKDMLDHLYTSQYQMSGIIAISLGRIECPNDDNFTHAVYMRFQRKEAVAKFYSSSFYSRILKGHVTPYCYGSISVDYESEVEDDIIPIFRRGEDYNYGVECLLLVSVSETAPPHAVEDALTSLQNLIVDFDSSIVQATEGRNLNITESVYTHAAVIRFPSLDAFKIFTESPGYKDLRELKFHPISKKVLLVHFVVDPVGTELM